MNLIVKTIKPINLTAEQQVAYDASLANPVEILTATDVPNLFAVRVKQFVDARAQDGQAHVMGLTDIMIEVEGGMAQLLPVETELVKNIRLRNVTPFVKGQISPIFEFRNMNNPVIGWEQDEIVAYLLLTPFTEAATRIDTDFEVDPNITSDAESTQQLNSDSTLDTPELQANEPQMVGEIETECEEKLTENV